MRTSSSCVDSTALPELAAGVAHDLRNILFVATAKCHELLQSFDLADPRREELRAIHEAAERASGLARHLLMCADGQAPVARPLDVNEIVRGVQPLLTHLLGDRVALTLNLTREPWPVSANATQIEQVVLNLATNSRDAMPEGGRLTISTENRHVTMPGRPRPAQSVVIAVTDTGSGMSADVQARMFDLHYTTKRESGGSGIGLATVHAIATLNGGHVEVSSAPGQGTTVRVVLPRAETPPPAETGPWKRLEFPSEPERAASPPPRRALDGAAAHERILLVEDDAGVRELLYSCLAGQGYDLVVARTGREALDAYAQSTAPVNLLVTDVRLPDIPGTEVARQLRTERPDLRVLFLSGNLRVPADLPGAGKAPVLTKPFSMSDLMRVVRATLDTKQAA